MSDFIECEVCHGAILSAVFWLENGKEFCHCSISKICQHGQSGSQCYSCELEKENAALREENEKLREELVHVNSTLKDPDSACINIIRQEIAFAKRLWHKGNDLLEANGNLIAQNNELRSLVKEIVGNLEILSVAECPNTNGYCQPCIGRNLIRRAKEMLG